MTFLLSVLRGVGQIMLQNNAATGLLFFLGLAINSSLMAGAALFGAVCGTGFAQLMKYPKAEIEQGLYGFNSALVAILPLLYFSLSHGKEWR